jgi:DNA-binding PadR family transcriptional regulator
MTGYQLSAKLKEPIGYFWSASHSQIYPELARLEGDGLITSEVVSGPGPRDTKRHSITATGRTALADWVLTPTPPDHRDPFLLRIYSIWLVDPERAASMVEDRISAHTASLAQYRTIERQLEKEHGGPPPLGHPDFGSWATLRRGLSFEKHELAWSRWLLTLLREGPRARS